MFKNQKPSTPSLRHTVIALKVLAKKPLLKSLIRLNSKSLGKCKHSGRIITRYKEVGAKKKYRMIDFKEGKELKVGVVCSLEHDPYRSANIMSVFSRTEKFFIYLLATSGINVGDVVACGKSAPIKNGNTTLISRLPLGAFICNVPFPGQVKGKLARSAGSYCVLKSSTEKFCLVESPSRAMKQVQSDASVTVGRVSNDLHFLERTGKAGRSRWKGRRPANRGVSMNPVDHPNGGGEGKKSGPGKTPWGGRIKGLKTSCSRQLSSTASKH